MALTDEGNGVGTTMLVQPSGINGNDGFGFGGNGFWILILFILLGGWNNGFGGGFGGGDLYPWMNNSQNINNGFRDQMLNDNITSIRDGVYGISNQLCNGFAGTTAAVTGAQNAITQQMYANQIADMQQAFALQSQLAQCCCDNRAATADLKYTVATENCADRTAAAQNTRDIIDSQTRGTQAILDKLCALELDGVKNQLAQAQRDNLGLQNQLNMANLAASQVQQTGNIRDTIIGELRSCPIPSQPVYGNQPIFTCGGTNAGCGCGNAF